MVRFGIVGFGLHAAKRLMPGFRLAKTASVTALSRRDTQKAEACAHDWDIPHHFATVEELCRCPKVDAVFVTTPNACHRQDVLTALRCGKPVLVEKPMGMNAEECREMVEAARRQRLALGVAHVFRFHESVALFQRHVEAGDLGKLIFARSEFSYPGRNHPRTWIHDRAIAGGGAISDVGVHCIDTLRYVLNDEVVRVQARMVYDSDSRDVESSAVLSVVFRTGTLGTILVSMRARYRTPLELIGEAGEVFADDALTVEHPVVVELRKGEDVARKEASNHLAYARQVDAFAATIEKGIPFPSPGENGWQNQVILDAAFQSARNGCTVTVPMV